MESTPSDSAAQVRADAPLTVRSFKAEVQTGGDPKFYANALRFQTRTEAEPYAADLAMRWLQVVDWRVAESDDPVNYKIEAGQLLRLEEVP